MSDDGLLLYGVDGQAGSSGRAPDQITNMTNWWDASDEATISDTGGLVDSVSDKIGSLPLTGIGAQRPETGNAIHDENGLNTIYFEGTLANLAANSGGVFPSVFWSMFVVNIGTVTAAADGLVTFRSSAGPPFNDPQLQAKGTTQFDGQVFTQNLNIHFDLTGGPYSGMTLVELQWDNVTAQRIECWMNEISRGTSAPFTASVTSDRMRLFVSSDASNRLEGKFCDGCLMQGNIPNAQDVADLRIYFKNKWGL